MEITHKTKNTEAQASVFLSSSRVSSVRIVPIYVSVGHHRRKQYDKAYYCRNKRAAHRVRADLVDNNHYRICLIAVFQQGDRDCGRRQGRRGRSLAEKQL